MRKYILDPYIVSILYQTESDEDTLKHYQEIISRMMQLVEESMRYFFTEKKLPADQVELILKSIETEKTDSLSPEVVQMLKGEELGQLITDSVDSLGKILYDSLLPTLDADSRKELNRYLETIEPIVKENALNILSTMLPIYNEKSDLNAIATEGQTQKPEEQSTMSTPTINLGGVNTSTQEISTEPVSQPTTPVISVVVPEEPKVAETPVENVIPEGSVVDMALEKAVETPQPEVFDQVEPATTSTDMPVIPATPIGTPSIQTPVTEPIAEVPVEIPAPPAPPVNEMVMPIVEPVVPEPTTSNEIQFTPLTEVPETTTEVPTTPANPEVQAPVEPIDSNLVIDNKLPELPTSAAAKLDGLGIDLNEGTENTKQ